MDSLIRSSSVDTLSKQLGTLSTCDKPSPAPVIEDYLLLSFHINVYVDPPKIMCDEMPVSTPDYVKARKTVTESDLYFLQWVFRDLFGSLNDIVARNYPGYKILRAEVEPGISWEDFRCDQRGLLVWLMKTRPEPFTQLSRLLDKAEESSKINRYELAIRVLSKQMSVMQRQIRRFRKEMDQSEQQFDETWKVISHALDVPTGPTIGANPPSGRETADWSVVEDETDDHELTSASLSGYDDYDSASDI